MTRERNYADLNLSKCFIKPSSFCIPPLKMRATKDFKNEKFQCAFSFFTYLGECVLVQFWPLYSDKVFKSVVLYGFLVAVKINIISSGLLIYVLPLTPNPSLCKVYAWKVDVELPWHATSFSYCSPLDLLLVFPNDLIFEYIRLGLTHRWIILFNVVCSFSSFWVWSLDQLNVNWGYYCEIIELYPVTFTSICFL